MKARSAAVAAVALLILTGTRPAAATTPPTAAATVPTAAATAPADATGAVARARPAAVLVTGRPSRPEMQHLPGLPDYPPPQGVPPPGPQRQMSHTAGGFLFDERGYVLTSHSAVARMRELRVELDDGRSFRAEMVGADEPLDVAVLRLRAGEDESPAGELPTIVAGDSDRLRVGQPDPGSRVPVRVWRDGGEVELQVEIGHRPARPEEAARPQAPERGR